MAIRPFVVDPVTYAVRKKGMEYKVSFGRTMMQALQWLE